MMNERKGSLFAHFEVRLLMWKSFIPFSNIPTKQLTMELVHYLSSLLSSLNLELIKYVFCFSSFVECDFLSSMV